jgi:hypothetical protein
MGKLDKTNDEFRFNRSRISGTSKSTPSSIDWSALQKNLEKQPDTAEKSLWGMVQQQSKTTQENRKRE